MLAGDLSAEKKTPRYAGNFKLVEFTTWISLFNINYFMAVDGISMPLVLLTAILSVLALFASFTTASVMKRGFKGYLALFLLLETGLLGVFVSLDFFLFYVFWEVVLLPMSFLLGIWGSREKKHLFGKLIEGRIYSSLKFFIDTLVGSVIMLLVMLFTYFETGTFNLLVLMNQLPNLTLDVQKILFMGLFVAFAIKVPLFPFHTWLPDAHVDAPTPISMILAGVLLKMGGYGFFRFSYPMLPDAASYFIWFVVIIALINIIYGALAAMGQKDFKKLVAYSSISHMGYVLLGLAAMTSLSANGAVMQMFNHGITSAMMFFVVGVLYERSHHRKIDDFGGMALTMPYFAGFATIAFFASLGLPGLNGFISVAMVFLGSFQAEPLRIVVIIASLGIVLTAAYLLWAWQRIFHGTHKKPEYETYPDLNRWEWATLAPLAALCLLVGILPHLVVNLIDPAVNYLVSLF